MGLAVGPVAVGHCQHLLPPLLCASLWSGMAPQIQNTPAPAWSCPGDPWLGLVLFGQQCGLHSRQCQLGSDWDLPCGEMWLIPESLQPLLVSPSLSLSSVAEESGRAGAPCEPPSPVQGVL